MLAREALLAGPHRAADLCRDKHLVSIPSCLEPASDHGLGLTARVPWRPGRIDIGRIDTVATGLDIGIKNGERCGVVDRPTKNVATQEYRSHLQAGATKFP